MSRLLLLVSAVLLSSPALADTNASSDTLVTGQVGVGTQVPYARMHVQDDANDTYAVRVASANGSVMFAILPSGKVGLMLSAPQARLDLNGAADNGDYALQLRVGNSSNTVLSQQVVFTSTAGTYGHAIVTQHQSDQNLNNAMHFYLWNSTGQPSAVASLNALSLQAIPTASTASVHVVPYGTPDVELEVSNGACTGCGTIHRASAGTHSSRELKTDIAYLDAARRKQAIEDIRALKHASFRYKRMVRAKPEPSKRKGKIPSAPQIIEQPIGPTIRGLIYEDAPGSIRGSGKTILLDNRVVNLEMALQEADKKIVAIEAQISELEKKKKGGRK